MISDHAVFVGGRFLDKEYSPRFGILFQNSQLRWPGEEDFGTVLF